MVAGLASVANLLAALRPLAQDRWDWHWGMHPMVWVWGAGGVVMLLMMLAFWGLVIAGVVMGIRWLASGGGGRRDEALEILRQRYARGEITREEFEARRQDLSAR